MPQRRAIKNRGLPRNVSLSRGWYFHVQRTPEKPHGRWVKLAREGDLPGMYRALAELLTGDGGGTFQSLFTRYRHEVLTTKAPKTQRDQGLQLDRLGNVFGHMPLGSLTRSHLNQYRAIRPPISFNRELALLNHACRKAIHWDLLDSNPCESVERNPETPAQEAPPIDQVMRAWLLADTSLRSAMALAFVIGQRPADVRKITEQDIDSKGLHLAQNKTKTRLLLEWTPNLRATVTYCKAQRRVTPLTKHLLLSPTGKPWTKPGFESAWDRLMTKHVAAGGQRFTFKNLRHLSADQHADGQHLGHKDPRILNRHYRRAETRVRPI